jgi:meso-butanediol dehydrogenase/(S,S)-butanediol dehydrogenase/diacetyl reductase
MPCAFDVESNLLKRIHTERDLVGNAIYLESSDSDFVTGQTVVVDGGVVLD